MGLEGIGEAEPSRATLIRHDSWRVGFLVGKEVIKMMKYVWIIGGTLVCAFGLVYLMN